MVGLDWTEVHFVNCGKGEWISLEREFEPLEEGIHVCYALSDPQGTYSKFAGASICSLLERTAAKVTVHILSDETLSGVNRQRFRQLVEEHGQEIRFYDVPRAVAGTWERARRIYPEGLQSERYTAANMYRLAMPEALPASVGKAIYLDADTIVHLDVSELWAETVNDSGLAAVSDLELLAHYGKQGTESKEASYLYAVGRARLETVFNAGVLVLRLDVLRQRESLLLEGIRLLAEQDGAYKFYDNDILISLFSEHYTHLPWRYNVRLNWDMAYGPKELVPAIYHCLGRNYSLEGRDPRHRLFLDCYRKTP